MTTHFRDIKAQADTPAVREIWVACMYNHSLERLASVIEKYQANPELQLFGHWEDSALLGVCGFEEHEDRVILWDIAVAEQSRRRGVGRAMIAALRTNYGKAIEAETDDEAVGFYRKCGFVTKTIQKYDTRRWVCVMPAMTEEERHAALW